MPGLSNHSIKYQLGCLLTPNQIVPPVNDLPWDLPLLVQAPLAIPRAVHLHILHAASHQSHLRQVECLK